MPTRIVFAHEKSLDVQDDLDAVNEELDAIEALGKQRVGFLTRDGKPVYVNPAAIAYLEQAPDRKLQMYY